MIEAANLIPDLSSRRSITTDALKRLDEPAVIFEHFWQDSDGVPCYAYTVAGYLNGRNIATVQGGCLVGGQAIIVHAGDRRHADALAVDGLLTTLYGLDVEAEQLARAEAALARLSSVGVLDRMDAAMRPDKSDAFVNDVDAIRPLIGDDILLTAKGTQH